MDDDSHRARVVYDIARPGTFLRWSGACRQCPVGADALLYDCLSGICLMGSGLIQFGLYRRYSLSCYEFLLKYPSNIGNIVRLPIKAINIASAVNAPKYIVG